MVTPVTVLEDSGLSRLQGDVLLLALERWHCEFSSHRKQIPPTTCVSWKNGLPFRRWEHSPADPVVTIWWNSELTAPSSCACAVTYRNRR